MKSITGYLAAVACLILSACATTMTATTDYDRSVDFSKYRTFSWIDPNPLIRSATQRPLSPLVERRLMDHTGKLLTARGLRFEPNALEAELVVAFTIGSRDGIRIDSFPTRSIHGGAHSRPPHGRHSRTWGGYWGGSTVHVRQYTEGQLAVDIFEVAEARPVWHGTTSTRVTRTDREAPDELIQEALEAILAEFPPN